MAYTQSTLSHLNTAAGFSVWHYATTDALRDVKADEYFSNPSDLAPHLRRGDMIIVNAKIKGTIEIATLFVKVIKASGKITTAFPATS